MGKKPNKRIKKKIIKNIDSILSSGNSSADTIENCLLNISKETEKINNLLEEISNFDKWVDAIEQLNTNNEEDIEDDQDVKYITKEIDGEYVEKKFYELSEDELFKLFFEQEEQKNIISTTDYSNENFCFFCKKYEVLPMTEIGNFLESHYVYGKNTKYLLLVFRLRPDIFVNFDIMENKHLKKYVCDYLKIKNYKSGNQELDRFIKSKYYFTIGNTFNTHVFENQFHQPNLTYGDYLKCDYCKSYLCPKHIYLSNCYFSKCNICKEKNWFICGWCKPNFNEVMACKHIHGIKPDN